jgi:hypothetical protein
MTRRAYALGHPISDPATDLEPYRRLEPQPDGNLLLSVLAIDR